MLIELSCDEGFRAAKQFSCVAAGVHTSLCARAFEARLRVVPVQAGGPFFSHILCLILCSYRIGRVKKVK